MEEVTNEYLEELDQYEEAVRDQQESEGKIKPVKCRKRATMSFCIKKAVLLIG